jgi:uncharacterized protein (TIGR03663 family)
MNKRAFAGLFLLFFIVAAGFRLADLGVRPMHHDEANQALKFGALLERGDYRYDRSDHHGPSLYYLSLPVVRSLGADTLAELSEKELRLVPALFGVGTALLLWLFVPLIGKEAALWGALGLAVSPVMVYFSRFYIQETLLLFFLAGSIGAVLRYRERPSWAWAVMAGFFAGLMYATKETSVLAFGAIGAALVLTRLTGEMEREREGERAEHGTELRQSLAEGQARGRDIRIRRSRFGVHWVHLTIGGAFAVLVSLLLFTSFFQNPRGWLDSILSFKVYFVRAGEAGFHVHPWPYYLRTLAFSRSASGPVWSEGLILALAVVGMVAAFRRRPAPAVRPAVLRFIAFYTLLSTAAYSLLPYKTPWNILPFYLGFIVLAGSGAAALLASFRSGPVRALIFVILAAGFLHLGIQARRASFVYPADPRNPYVYAQTSPDFLKLARRVEDLAAVHPDHENMLVKVIAGPYETWPLPWYLRRFGRVGYWQETASAGPPEEAPVIISDTPQAGLLESLLKTSFQSEYYELRPGVFLVLHVRADLWHEYLRSRPGN